MLIFKVIHLQLRMRPLCIAFFFPLLMFFPPCTFCFLILTINVELNALHVLGSASQSYLSYYTMYSLAFIHNSFTFLKHLSCHHHSAFAYDNLTTFAWWYKQIIQVSAPMKLPQKGSDLSGQILVAYNRMPLWTIFQARILEWVAISFSRLMFLDLNPASQLSSY